MSSAETRCGAVPPCKGVYVLVLELPVHERIEVGSLGVIEFEPGYYLYVGSARGPGGVRARVCRHSRGPVRKWWHIDYLLGASRVVGACYSCTLDPGSEARLASACLVNASPYVRGFGSSDSRDYTHLFTCQGDCLDTARRCLEEASRGSPGPWQGSGCWRPS